MQQTSIINGFTKLLHQHGPDSQEVESYIEQYGHLERFVSQAITLQSVFREKENFTRIHE